MGYMKVIEADTTWECPRTGSYKIICVAGGEGGANNYGVKSFGGSTSFGNYLTASGCWGGMNSGIYTTSYQFPGRNGYTFLNYGDYDQTNSSSVTSVVTSIGYGGGGSGPNPGGCGKLKMSIVTLNKGDTVNCVVGEGGSGDCESGRPGVIVIQYQGDDGWSTSDNETLKQVSINLYAYGDLVDTITVFAGEQVTLPKLENIKPDDNGQYGWTKTPGETTRNYSPEAVIYPTSDMDLYAIFNYRVLDSVTYVSGGGTVDCAGTAYFSGYKLTYRMEFPEGGGSSTQVGNDEYSSFSLKTDGSSPYISINGRYIGGTLSESSEISYSVKAGDVISCSTPPQSSAPTYNGSNVTEYTSYTIKVRRPSLTYSNHLRSDIS